MVSIIVLVRIKGRYLRVFPSVLCLAADSSRYGIVALIVFHEPKTSISITDLKALDDIWFIGARKFPAAPAL